MSEKALPGRAIYGWDSTNETWVKILVDTSGNLQITSTNLTTILSEIQNATYGLEALKTAIDAIDVSGTADAVWDEAKSGHVTAGTFGKEVQDILTALQHGTYGLSAIETLVDEVETYLKHATYGLSALDTDLGTIITYLESATYGLSALETLVDEIESLLKNETYGLSAIEALVDDLESRLTATRAGYLDELDFDLSARLGSPAGASLAADLATISGKTTNLPTDPADASDIAADFDRHLSHVDFWSITDDVIAITATADQDYNLPDVTVPALPTGATIYKVYLLFKCALIRDTSGADNGIDEAGIIRIKTDGDADFDANGATAYTIADNMWLVDVTNVGRDRGGDAFVGDTDISAKVTGADTYNIRLDSISADGANLELHDVAVGLRVIFY